MDNINKIIKHIADGNAIEERMVNVMGGTIEETASYKCMREENEKVAFKIFINGENWEFARNCVSTELVPDEKLKEIQKLALQTLSSQAQ